VKYLLSSTIAVLSVVTSYVAAADEVTLIAPGGMRCAVDRIAPEFERKTGHKLTATIGSGGATHQRVVQGDVFDVPIVQPPYQDVIASGHVIASTETPLAKVPMVIVVKRGAPRPDISTPDAVKRLLLGAKFISFPDGAGGRGGAAGVSFDATQKQLGIYDQLQPKIKRIQVAATLAASTGTSHGRRSIRTRAAVFRRSGTLHSSTSSPSAANPSRRTRTRGYRRAS